MFYAKLHIELLWPLHRGLHLCFWIGRNPRHRFRARLFRFIHGSPQHFIFEHISYKPDWPWLEED